MRHASFSTAVRRALVAVAIGVVRPALGVAQATSAAPPPATAAISQEEITAFAKVHLAVAQARDSIQLQLAQPGNKKPEAQRQLQEKLQAEVADILHHAGMTQQEFERKTYLVSTDAAARHTFDTVIAQLTGQPTPGQVMATAATAARPAAPAPVSLPAGPVGVHIGHVVNGFSDTPNGQGLLPTAMAEARIAIQHAGLAARNTSSLDAMKLHAGHVINALDPTVVATGPGLGYGVKKAAMGVATHIELAAKAQGASPNVVSHSVHIATSARNTVQRADQIVALAKQIQAATSATDAAALVSQMVSQCDQLMAGADANGDGRITWEAGEGGLQQVQQHVNLMLAAESKAP
ncbi:MAG TPA: DUF4168 domain-containing protein [Gemmatimonadaceae bacterium]